MLRQRARLVGSTLFVADLLLIVAAYIVAYVTRDVLFTPEYDPLFTLTEYLWLLLGILPSWSLLLYYFKLYDSYRTAPFWVEPWAILKVTFWGTLTVGILIFALKLHFVSRLFIFIFGVIVFLLLSTVRTGIRFAARYVRRRGLNYRNILLVGTGRQATELANTIGRYKDWGLRICGIVLDSEGGDVGISGEYPVKGTIEDIPRIITDEIIDEVIFAVSRNRLEDLEEVFLTCEKQGVRTRVALNFFSHVVAKARLEDLGEIPLLTFSTTPYNEWLLAFKRAFDIFVSGILLIMLIPVFLFIALAVKLTSPGPMFFRQIRVGMNGRRFALYKFRSMVSDAEIMKKDLFQLNEMDGPVFKIRNDPRLTRIGKFIRRFSFDELPQLVNVLKGDMSIVGPRPPVPEEVAHYERWHRRRLSMKPGLTCLWQIQGRNRIKDFDDWMKLDLQYIDNWSLKLDLKIFFKTIPTVFLARGAS
jgi:exopolysaccharide biosynthesis polyprenyl glycosylphosphotransferase